MIQVKYLEHEYLGNMINNVALKSAKWKITNSRS